MKNRKLVISNYDSFDEDNRAKGTRAEQLEFIYTKKLLDQYVKPHMEVAEIGCGTGYYGLYLSDLCSFYHGVDLTPRHIEQFKEKIKLQGLTNVEASLGDATNLKDIAGEQFDLVMVFGPLYHLPKEEWRKVILESKRICRPGGIMMFAYINKIGAYLKGCIDENLKSVYPNKKTNKYVLEQGVDDVLPGVFYYTMPEEVEQYIADEGLAVIENAGVAFDFNSSDINRMDTEQYDAWTDIMDYMFKSRSCTGVSNHAVLICQKPAL